MKSILAYYLVAGVLCCKASAANVSDATNGIYVVVGALRHGAIVTNEPIRFDDSLAWTSFCDTGQVELFIDLGHSTKVTMSDSDGKPVSETAQGNAHNSLFDSVHSISDLYHPFVMLARGSYKDDIGLGGGSVLPAPDELFEMRKPGIYNMEIQIQVFLTIKNPNQWSHELLRFEPVKIRVEKPPKEK